MMTATMGAEMMTFLPALLTFAGLLATFLRSPAPHAFKGSGHKTVLSSK